MYLLLAHNENIWSVMVNGQCFNVLNYKTEWFGNVLQFLVILATGSVWTSLNMLEPRHLIGWCLPGSTNPGPVLPGACAAQQVVNMFEATAVCRAVISFIYSV